jgi:hypothetical protein
MEFLREESRFQKNELLTLHRGVLRFQVDSDLRYTGACSNHPMALSSLFESRWGSKVGPPKIESLHGISGSLAATPI